MEVKQFGRKQIASPCYGKAVGHLTLIVSTFIGVLTTFSEATPMKIVVVAFTTTLMLAEASHAADKMAYLL